MLAVILVLAVAETAWALFSACTGLNILAFYAVLVIASAVFWVPRLTETRAPSPKAPQEGPAGNEK